MLNDILSPYLSEADRAVCLHTLTELRSLVTDESRRLVFFVGAGISSNTGMPLVFELLDTLLMDALKRSASDEAWRDIPEVKRLCGILADEPRTKHFFEGQLPTLKQMCAPPPLQI